MRKRDSEALGEYLQKLEFARSSIQVNPYETIADQKLRINRAKVSVKWCVEYYFPHYATSESADFQVSFANKVLKEPTIKAFAQWGRGLAKSVWCDVILPFWLWLNNQAHYFVLIGANATRACELLDDLQAEFEANPQIIKDFGEQKQFGDWESGNWKTVGCKEWGLKGFKCKALGMGEPCRGLRKGSQRPNLISIDDVEGKDLVKNPKRQDEWRKWVENDLLPTMDGAIRRLLYANNRYAPRMIQTELQKLHPNWYVSHVPAYDFVSYLPVWHQKYHDDYYRELETEIGKIALMQEYGQEGQIEGKIFKEGQIIWDKLPRLSSLKIIVAHWDVAYAGTSTSDYNAVRIWGLCKNNLFWYIQSFVKQSKMSEAVRYMCEVQKGCPKDVIIHWQFESQFWNDEVSRTITEVSKAYGVILNISKVDTPRVNKYSRILSTQPKYQNNRIRYNKEMQADNDTQIGLQQLYGIEPGYHTKDDAPDADEQCLSFLEKHITIGSSSGNFLSGKMLPKNQAI